MRHPREFWTERRTDGRMDGCVDERTDGRINERTNEHSTRPKNHFFYETPAYIYVSYLTSRAMRAHPRETKAKEKLSLKIKKSWLYMRMKC